MTIKLIESEAVPAPTESEWFIVVFQYDNGGNYWASGSPFRSQIEAEKYLSDFCANAKNPHIIKVKLPNITP